MQAGSSTYLTFAAGVFFLYWVSAGSRLTRLALILTGNLLFAAQYSFAYVLILPVCATLDFTIGLALSHTSVALLRRLLLACSVSLNIALLVTAREYAAISSNAPGGPLFPSLALPLGLSFYALQALTYTIDVYRKDGKPVSGLLQYLASATFFPTLEAGPIARLTSIIGQFSTDKRLNKEDGARALLSIGLGVVKKAVVADYLARNLVDRVFDTPTLYSGLEVLIGIYGHSLQLYYDFSGYTDIARGVALLLGIRLPANFNRPYAAANLTDFWKRWHMSFSGWLRDYVFFSLPGGRTLGMPYVNLVITMVVAGLWHGLTLTFAIWGVLHGLGLAVTRLWWALRGRPADENTWGKYIGVFFTYHFVCLTWIVFRSESLEVALAILERIGSLTIGWDNLPLPLVGVLCLAALTHFIGETWRSRATEIYVRSPVYVQACVLTALAIAVQILHGAGSTPFVYSRF